MIDATGNATDSLTHSHTGPVNGLSMDSAGGGRGVGGGSGRIGGGGGGGGSGTHLRDRRRRGGGKWCWSRAIELRGDGKTAKVVEVDEDCTLTVW